VTNVLSAEIGLVDDIYFGRSADEFLSDDTLALESDINIPARLVDDDTALQASIAPFLFHDESDFTNFRVGTSQVSRGFAAAWPPSRAARFALCVGQSRP
jgi:hypothetical protein